MGLTQKLGTIPLAILTDSSNNVGIGAAANASFKLQVTGATNLTGALSGTSATFSSSVKVASSSTGGLFEMGSGANANSRSFRLASDVNDWGDFGIQVSNSQTGTTYTNALLIGRTGAATFSSSVTANGDLTLTSAATGGVIITNNNNSHINLFRSISPTANFGININGNGDLNIDETGVATRVTIKKTSGNVLIGPTTDNGSRLRIIGATNEWGIDTQGSTTTSQSYGILVRAGTNSTDRSFQVTNSASTSTYFVVRGDGNVGIGTTGPGAKLDVSGNAGAYACSLQASTTSGQSYGLLVNGGSTSGDYSFYVRNAAQGSPYIYVRGDGYLYSASAWSGSDRRLKENISDLDNGLNKVLGLKARKFDFIDGFKNQYGFIAQELQEIIPDAVSVFDEKEEMLAVKMDFIIPHLVKAIQEQTQIIKDLEARIVSLESK
jgi:hypothetical protein